MISGAVVGATKIFSDLAYTWLNPRITLRSLGGGGQ
jgi:peptide/nickel transport system permease protein